MIQLKPFFVETKNYLFTYHGGGFSPELLRETKRSNIKSYTKASQKRLLLYLDTVMNFNPTYIFFLEYPNYPDFDTAFKTLKSFIRSLSNRKYNKNKIPPLFIWKKTLYKNSLVFEVMTNLSTTIPDELFVKHFRYVLRHFDSNIDFNILEIDKDNEELVRMDFGEYRTDFSSTITDDSTGRWWGVINRSYYHCTEPTKKEASLNRIISKEVSLDDENKVSANIYSK